MVATFSLAVRPQAQLRLEIGRFCSLRFVALDAAGLWLTSSVRQKQMKYARLLGMCIIAWWPMMVVHEAGHILGCLFTGAEIERVILWPWTISQTVRSGSSAPAVDTWLGPLFGALAPIAMYLPFHRKSSIGMRMLGFFSGFCLISNGLYLGLGWIERVGDTGDLMRLGASPILLSSIGVLLFAAGLYIWHLESLKSKDSA
jgi:hypothetical protein